MPACFFVDIAEAHLYFDKNRRPCRAPGSRPAGAPNIIYFVRTLTPWPLLHRLWNDELGAYSTDERRDGFEWTKDSAYEFGQPFGPPARPPRGRPSPH
jgi:hypothetical protein